MLRVSYELAGVVRIATFLEDAKDTKVPPGHNSKLETGMVGLKNQVIPFSLLI